MKIGIKQGRDIKKDLEIGICGEHGGDPNSIKFCHSADVSYVSASPHRIPIAIVAAAQAAIEQKSTKKSKTKKKSRRWYYEFVLQIILHVQMYVLENRQQCRDRVNVRPLDPS